MTDTAPENLFLKKSEAQGGLKHNKNNVNHRIYPWEIFFVIDLFSMQIQINIDNRQYFTSFFLVF